MGAPHDGLSKRSDFYSAFRIAAIYLLFAALWILLSDRAVSLFIAPSQLEGHLWFQTLKGLAFVLVTSVLLMMLVMHRLGQTRQAAREAADLQQRLLAFVNHFPGVVYIRDSQSRFILLSGQIPSGGVPPERLIGRTDEDQHTPETFQRLVKRDKEVIASGTPTQLLESVVVAGRTLHYLVHRFPLTGPQGEPWVAGLGIDITERQQAEERIRELARELAKASRMKDQFLTNLSHELRTPVTAIRLWAEVLKDPSPTDMETIREAATMIQHSAQTQSLLIEDLLDVTRIIGGQLRVEMLSVRLDEVIHKTLELLLPMANEHEVRFELEIVEQPPCKMLGDARRVQQVIWNLLTNAVKFSEPGGAVRCRLVRDAGEWVITVSDEGRGIAREHLTHVFERFRPLEMNQKRIEGGIGIGLSIVKHLVEAHGGVVRADSPGLGHGATFTVRFPTAPQSDAADRAIDTLPPPLVPSREMPLNGRRVLVVEDDADSRSAMTTLFRRSGAEVVAVDSSEAALALEGRFDVLVSDIGLPGRDGCALVRELRERPEWQEALAIACSAYALPEDRSRALDHGFDEFVTKPVESADLIELMTDRLAERQKGKSTVSAVPVSPNGK